MAVFTRVNGGAAPMKQVGRDLLFKNISKGSTMQQFHLDDAIQAIQATSTVTVIGTFTPNSSTQVNVVVEGSDISTFTANSVSYTVTTIGF